MNYLTRRSCLQAKPAGELDHVEVKLIGLRVVQNMHVGLDQFNFLLIFRFGTGQNVIDGSKERIVVGHIDGIGNLFPWIKRRNDLVLLFICKERDCVRHEDVHEPVGTPSIAADVEAISCLGQGWTLDTSTTQSNGDVSCMVGPEPFAYITSTLKVTSFLLVHFCIVKKHGGNHGKITGF
jgi:hypothetical protein